MGRQKRVWQDVDYVLGYFGRTVGRSRKAYLGYVASGVEQGRRDELMGGGLIRSLGGWSEVQQMRRKGPVDMMSDERILGESDFVDSVLSQANERYERHYELKRRGYDLDRIAERVAEVCQIHKDEIFSRGLQVKARSLLCFWAVREAGMSQRELARRLEMSGPGVGFAVERGAAIARENNYSLLE